MEDTITVSKADNGFIVSIFERRDDFYEGVQYPFPTLNEALKKVESYFRTTCPVDPADAAQCEGCQ